MKRQEVKEQYKWKIEDIFPSDEAWEASFEKAKGMISFSK